MADRKTANVAGRLLEVDVAGVLLENIVRGPVGNHRPAVAVAGSTVVRGRVKLGGGEVGHGLRTPEDGVVQLIAVGVNGKADHEIVAVEALSKVTETPVMKMQKEVTIGLRGRSTML